MSNKSANTFDNKISSLKSSVSNDLTNTYNSVSSDLQNLGSSTSNDLTNTYNNVRFKFTKFRIFYF